MLNIESIRIIFTYLDKIDDLPLIYRIRDIRRNLNTHLRIRKKLNKMYNEHYITIMLYTT